MDEAWERAVEAALEGQAADSPRTLTLDGAVKCLHGRLPPPELLERFRTLEHLSIANVGVSSLDKFPRLPNLQRLILSDNRISGGLEFLVAAGLESLRDLDLSNNRIQSLEDLAPLSSLRLVSLDLYECPVTRIRDYRSRVFALIRSLKYLDKMDADENEPPETDEDDDDDEEAEEEEEEDPGSGEIDGEDRAGKVANGVAGRSTVDGVVDEDEESDADEEETVRSEANGSHHPHLANGFRVVPVGEDEDDVDDDDFVVDEVKEEEEDVDDEDFVVDEVGDDDGGEDGDPVEEIDEEDGEDEDVVEVHDISDSDEEEEEVDGFEVEEVDLEEEEDDDDDVDGDGDEDVEDEDDDGEPGSTARMTSTDGEIDGHEQGEEDENGEIGEEEEQGVEEEPDFEELDGDGEDEEEDDLDGDYLVQQHIPQAVVEEAGGSDLDACNGEDEDGVEDDDEDDGHPVPNNGPSSSSHRCNGEDEDGVDDDDDDLDGQPVENNGPLSSPQQIKRKRGDSGECDGDDVEDLRSSKHP